MKKCTCPSGFVCVSCARQRTAVTTTAEKTRVLSCHQQNFLSVHRSNRQQSAARNALRHKACHPLRLVRNTSNRRRWAEMQRLHVARANTLCTAPTPQDPGFKARRKSTLRTGHLEVGDDREVGPEELPVGERVVRPPVLAAHKYVLQGHTTSRSSYKEVDRCNLRT